MKSLLSPQQQLASLEISEICGRKSQNLQKIAQYIKNGKNYKELKHLHEF